MYQLLLVDDEVHAIEGVKADLDLDKLGLSRLFTAYNIRQAKEILLSEQIHILLCDIEMPQGSGLELLSWVNEHRPEIVTIFLTSHADFKYAKEALRLGSLEYVLKPVLASDLEAVIRKAQNVLAQTSEKNRNIQSHQLWMKHHSLIIERFWLDLINHTIPSNAAAIREQVERHRIPITEESQFLPVLISIQHWKETLKPRDEKLLEYALKKSAEEMIMDSGQNGIVFHLSREQMLVIYITDQQDQWTYDALKEMCRKYIHYCNRHFYCTLSCYIGHPCGAHQMAEEVSNLQSRSRNNVAFVNQVFAEEGAASIGQTIVLPDLNVWISYLNHEPKEAVMKGVEKFIDNLVMHKIMDARILHQFHQDFLQALYSFLRTNEIQAHQLFGDEQSKRMAELAGRSVKEMMEWVHFAVSRALHQVELVRKSASVVHTIKRYIEANLDQDLSREAMAEQVFLNPDHLSRLFKKETGHSLSDYILLERIKRAKELLIQTKMPISEIAFSVGYNNFSHFAKIFKKYVEMGPSEYRTQVEKQFNPRLTERDPNSL